MKEPYRTDFEVRDSELDIQGIVNHANYFVYMEHARIKMVKELAEISFSEFSKEGKNLIIRSLSSEFKKPLRSGDKFYIMSDLEAESNLQFAIKQEIYRQDELIMKAKFIITCYEENSRKRFYIPDAIHKLIKSL